MIESRKPRRKRKKNVIYVKPNTLEFAVGGVEIRDTIMEFSLKGTAKNMALVKKWMEEGVTNAEVRASDGRVFRLVGCARVLVDDFSNDRGEIHVTFEGMKRDETWKP